jgi:trimethylamine--corrinoid protein Co-methyltransferase
MRRRPLITATECPVSPLQHDRRPLIGIMEFAKHGLPVIIYSEPKAGATAPASLAGTLIVSNCEVLSGLTLMQVINPGAPVIYGSVATLMDMRTGSIAFGSPETALLAACTTQMARSYGLPNMTPGGRTDSKMPDEQAGYEKMRTALTAALAGASLGNMAGLLESNLVASFQQLVIDDEMIGSIERVARGVDFDDDALALSLIEDVGPGGTYISKRHTMDRLRKEHYMPRASDRRYYSGWVKDGRRTMVDWARDRAMKIMAEHLPRPIGCERDLAEVLSQAQKAAVRGQ